jgi:hypothetical protein
MSIKNCKACDHFCDSGQTIGTCRRYPVFQTRSPNEWCGEFASVPYAEPVTEMLALPVLDEPPRQKRKYTRKEKA